MASPSYPIHKPLLELVSREEAVRLVRAWIKTPYILRGRVRGAGCDCATLVAENLIEIGKVSKEDLEDLGFYTSDWFCHTTNEKYLMHVLRHVTRVAETICRGGLIAEPGNLALFKVVNSRVYNHAAIITKWPFGVHALATGVAESNLASHPLTAFRKMDLFDPWVKETL